MNLLEWVDRVTESFHKARESVEGVLRLFMTLLVLDNLLLKLKEISPPQWLVVSIGLLSNWALLI